MAATRNDRLISLRQGSPSELLLFFVHKGSGIGIDKVGAGLILGLGFILNEGCILSISNGADRSRLYFSASSTTLRISAEKTYKSLICQGADAPFQGETSAGPSEPGYLPVSPYNRLKLCP